jgi:hypothetical protein
MESLSEQLLKKQCSICLCEIEKGQNISIPPCECKDILYHMECYYKWLEQNPTCPHCRTPIKMVNTDDETVDGDEEEDEEVDGDGNEPEVTESEYHYDSDSGILTRTRVIRIHENSRPIPLPLTDVLTGNTTNRRRSRLHSRFTNEGESKKCSTCLNVSVLFFFLWWLLYPIFS